MINAGIRSDKFEDGMLKKSTSLGQWLIKELVRPPFLPLSPSLLHFPTQTPDPLNPEISNAQRPKLPRRYNCKLTDTLSL